MTDQQKAVERKVDNIGVGKCCLCGKHMMDCVRFRFLWIFHVVLCDGCGAAIFKRFDKRFGGEVG